MTHIVCIKASEVLHRANGLVELNLTGANLMIGQRAALERDTDFRQVIPVAVFTYNGRVWAYQRTTESGESRLHGATSVCVGGHWDANDLVFVNSTLQVEQSIHRALMREVVEEVDSAPVTACSLLPKLLCCDETEVDRLHVAVVTIFELCSPDVRPSESALFDQGFHLPEELIKRERLESWAKLICSLLIDKK